MLCVDAADIIINKILIQPSLEGFFDARLLTKIKKLCYNYLNIV